MSSIYKNGIVSTDEITESLTTMLNTFTSGGYTPSNIQNACIQSNINGFVKGKKYAVEIVLQWSGFKTNAATNFNAYFQGSICADGSWTWNASNYLTNAINSVSNLKDTVLNADSGTKYIYTEFTSSGDATGYGLGMRFDYSNGTGSIAYSNLKVTPLDSFVKSNNDGGKLYDSKIIMNDFIEI